MHRVSPHPYPHPKAEAINRRENKGKPQETGKVCTEEREKERRQGEKEREGTLISPGNTEFLTPPPVLPCPSA